MVTINKTLLNNYGFRLHIRFFTLFIGTLADGIIGLLSFGFLFPVISYPLLDRCWNELQRVKDKNENNKWRNLS